MKSKYIQAAVQLGKQSATMLAGIILMALSSFAQDSITNLGASANIHALTVSQQLGIVFVVAGLIYGGVSRRIGQGVMICAFGGALSVAPRLLTTFQGFF